MARRNRNSSRKESAPGWVWMLFGLSMGLMVAIVAYLRAPGSLPASEPAATRAAAQPANEPAAQRATPRATRPPSEQTPPTENRFEFYEILPQFEVVVPEDDTPRATAAARPRPAETPGSFLLQAGSFSAPADADRLKANLALLGFESHVQRVRIEDDVFNRVRIGPIGDIDAAKRTQRQLRDAGIDTLLMQVPK
jgi:cell division protein FtsN